MEKYTIYPTFYYGTQRHRAEEPSVNGVNIGSPIKTLVGDEGITNLDKDHWPDIADLAAAPMYKAALFSISEKISDLLSGDYTDVISAKMNELKSMVDDVLLSASSPKVEIEDEDEKKIFFRDLPFLKESDVELTVLKPYDSGPKL
jgi:hypothetical protein